MKKGKAAGPTGIVSEMFMADEDCSVEWLTSLCSLIVAQGRIPDDWKSSILLAVYKGKGDPIECGSYRAIKLLEHAMKVIERRPGRGPEIPEILKSVLKCPEIH